MSQIAVLPDGRKVRWDESKKMWVPVETAVTDKGVGVEFDGTKWNPVSEVKVSEIKPEEEKPTEKEPVSKHPWYFQLGKKTEVFGRPKEPIGKVSLKDILQATRKSVGEFAAFPASVGATVWASNQRVPMEKAEQFGSAIGQAIQGTPSTPEGEKLAAYMSGVPHAIFGPVGKAIDWAAKTTFPKSERGQAWIRTSLGALILIAPFAKGMVKGFINNRIKTGKGVTPKELDAIVKQTPLPKDVAEKVASTRLESPPPPTGDPVADAAALEAFNAAQKAKEAARPPSPGIPKQEIPEVTPGEIPGVKPPKIQPINQTPQQMLVDALKQSKAIQPQQKALYRKERGKRVGEFEDIPEGITGEERLYAKLGVLKGELPKVDFEPLNLPKAARDALQDDIHFSLALEPLEKVHAGVALDKMLKGKFPAPNEVKLFNKVFGGELMDALMKRMSTRQQVMYWGGQILNVPRSIMASFDLSAPLRQGIWLVGRPKEFFGSFRGMFQSFVKEANYSRVMGEIAQRPNYGLMRESGLDITGVSASLKGMEEPFLGADLLERLGAKAVKKWPDIRGKALNVIPTGIRASQRAYTAFLNKLRADYFDRLINDAKDMGLYDVKERGGNIVQNIYANPTLTEDISRYINAATGRGRLLESVRKGSDILNAAFFSPRLISSRMTLLNPGTYINIPIIGRGTHPFVRGVAWRDAAAFASTYFVVSGLSALVAGKGGLGTDPRSADFGKTIIGNTSVDFMGGIGQYGRVGIQAVLPLLEKLGFIDEAVLVSSASGRKTKIGGKMGEKSVRDILSQFITNKQSPIFSLIWEAMGQRSSEGEKIKLGKELQERITPMIVQDLIDIYKDDPNLLKMAIVGLGITFGAGAQTYPVKKEKSLLEKAPSTRQEMIANKATVDPIESEFNRLGVKTNIGTKTVGGKLLKDIDNEAIINETRQRLRVVAGMYLNSPIYQRANDEQKKKILQKALDSVWGEIRKKYSKGMK